MGFFVSSHPSVLFLGFSSFLDSSPVLTHSLPLPFWTHPGSASRPTRTYLGPSPPAPFAKELLAVLAGLWTPRCKTSDSGCMLL